MRQISSQDQTVVHSKRNLNLKEAKNGRDPRSSIIRVVCSYLPAQMQVDLGECHKAKLKPGALDIGGSEIGRRGISAHIYCSLKLLEEPEEGTKIQI